MSFDEHGGDQTCYKRMEHPTPTTTMIDDVCLFQFAYNMSFTHMLNFQIVVRKMFVLKNLETLYLNVFATLPFFVEFKCNR